MDKLKAQENQAEIQELQKLLQSSPKETKMEHEWQLLENSLFARLDEVEKSANSKKNFLIFKPVLRFFPGNIPAVGHAVALLILVVVGVMFWNGLFSPDNLKYSRILGIKGDVAFHTQGSENKVNNKKDIQKELKSTAKDKPPGLYKNQVLETGKNATLIVQIDKKSHFILSQESKLTVRKASMKNIVFFLHKGEILCSVDKRRKNQTFTVLTPNTVSKIIGTVFRISTFTENADKRITDLSVLEGKVEISNYEKYLGTDIVKTGQTISISNKEFSPVKGISENQIPIHAISMIKLLADPTIKDSEPQGILDIVTEPLGAEVVVKDKIVGKTPLLIKCPVGSYSLTLKKEGFETWVDKVEINTRKISFVNARLTFDNVASAMIDKNVKCRKNSELTKLSQINRKKKEATSLQNSTEHVFVMNPAFVEALVQMTIGEFQKALVILDSLKDLPEISFSEKIRIIDKISDCYKGMGNFSAILDNLTSRYNAEKKRALKANLLWEIITVKANCLGDYISAEKDLKKYIKQYPDGGWIEPAYMKLGEIQYMSENFTNAVNSYKRYVVQYKTGDFVDNAIYLIANIKRVDLKDYKAAISWYTKLIENYPSSNYLGNAIFERAECYKKQKLYGKARKDYKKYLKLFPDGHLKSFCLSSL